MELLFDDGRCRGDLTDILGNLGTDLSEEACKQRCLDTRDCNFVFMNDIGTCTYFTSCDGSRRREGLKTWRKIVVNTDATSSSALPSNSVSTSSVGSSSSSMPSNTSTRTSSSSFGSYGSTNSASTTTESSISDTASSNLGSANPAPSSTTSVDGISQSTASSQSSSQMELLFDDGRCRGDLTDILGNLGTDLSEEACKQRCLDTRDCNFVFMNDIGTCTYFTSCDGSRRREGLKTWRKVAVSTDVTSSASSSTYSVDSLSNTPSTSSSPSTISSTPGRAAVAAGSTSFERMVRFLPPGRRCQTVTSEGLQQAGVPGGLGIDVGVEECLEACRADSDCNFVEILMNFDGSNGACTKIISCEETEASEAAAMSFQKVPEGSFDSPQWMMHCPTTAALTTACMPGELYDLIVASIRELTDSLSNVCNAEECEQADFAGCVLRMAGHDLMDYDPVSKKGGSDACTDMEDGDNAGLSECLFLGVASSGVSLQNAYEKFCDRVSLADFLVIAAEAVMAMRAVGESQAYLSEQFKAHFLFGRTTAFQGCSYSHGVLPNPANSCVDVERVFVNALGLTWPEAAALMGVHTLGRAELRNSGYSGWWSTPEHSRRFNRDFFVSILAKGWCPEINVNGCSAADEEAGLCTPKNQWQRCETDREEKDQTHEMMLNTDMCLFYNDQEGGDGVLRAGEDDCCGWSMSFFIDMRPVIEANDGMLCNVPCSETFRCYERSLEQRQLEIHTCCGSQEDGNGQPGRRGQDCRSAGVRESPGGPASDAVLLYARDEAAWLRAFMRSWNKVTTNGFEGTLKPLGLCS